MLTIFKYSLHPGRGQNFRLPEGAKPLTAQMQSGELCIWVQFEDARPLDELHTFDVYGTGHILRDDPGTYIATVQDGPFVWHIYERTP